MYGEKTTGWNVRLFLRSQPILYGFWHAYKFRVAQTFRFFWPIMTFFRKGLLRSGDTVPCFPKLITMKITGGALLLGMGPHIRRLNRKCHSLGLAHPANWYAVCKAMQVLLTQYCPMLLCLVHLVRQCNWSGETANTGFFASEGLHIVMCLFVSSRQQSEGSGDHDSSARLLANDRPDNVIRRTSIIQSTDRITTELRQNYDRVSNDY